MLHLANFIIDNKINISSIILGKIGNDFDYFAIIEEFNLFL